MEFAIISLYVLCFLALWYLRCMKLAALSLDLLADLIAEQDDFVMLFRQYWKVSYDKHVWALFFFRDPWKLYSKEIQDIMKGKDGL